MFDYAYGSDFNGVFAPDNAYFAEETGFLEAPRPRKEFRRQKMGIYLLSDLFSASFMGRSRFVRDRRLVGLTSDKRVHFTGETFDQWDLDVLLHCVLRTLAERGEVGKIQVEAGRLLRDMGLRNFEENRERVYSSLFRLHTGSLLIEGDGYRHMTRLVDRVLFDQSKSRCLVEVNGDVVDSLRHVHNLRMNVEGRLGFRRNGLAKWLHGAVVVFRGGFRADIDSLHSLCGASRRNRYIFPQMLWKALETMESNGAIGFWQIEGRRVTVQPNCRQENDSACGFIASEPV